MTTNQMDNPMNLVAMGVDGEPDTLVMMMTFMPGMVGQVGMEGAWTGIKVMKEVENSRLKEKNMLVIDRRTNMGGNRADYNKRKELQSSRTKVGP